MYRRSGDYNRITFDFVPGQRIELNKGEKKVFSPKEANVLRDESPRNFFRKYRFFRNIFRV